MLTVLAIGVFLLVVVVLMVRRKSSVVQRVPQNKRNEFGGVALRPALESCEAAKQLAGRRLLMKDAPALPLEGCTERCRCAYKRFTDRRHELRRATDCGIAPPIIFDAQERRKNLNRRNR